MQSVVDLRRRSDRDGEGTSKKKGKSPLKLFSSSFSALARFEVGREPARALRLRDSMRSVCRSEALAPRCSGFALVLTNSAKPGPGHRLLLFWVIVQ
jgi:hypothetical protein